MVSRLLRRGRAAGATPARFRLRLLAAYALSLVLIGAVQYAVSADRARESVLDEVAHQLDEDARLIERAHLRADDGETPLNEVREVVEAIAASPDIEYAALIDTHRSTVAGSRPPRALADDGELTAALFAGQTTARAVADESGFRFLTPVNLADGRYALEVAQDARALNTRFADLRRASLMLVIFGLLIGPPAFYLLGGRALTARHDDAIARSLRDGLTGLGNQAAYRQELEDAVAAAERHGEPLALALLDLDDFKLANDRRGHRFGDRVLAYVGEVLASGRAGDRGFRIGGDEFALLLPRTSASDAAVAVERLRREIGLGTQGVTLSAGVAGLGAFTTGVEALAEAADAALYEAKHRGRNQLVEHTDIELRGDSGVTSERIGALLDLLRTGDLPVALQPIRDLDSERTLGYEALARPQSEAFAGPADAFELAHRLGRVPELDALCLRQAARAAERFPDDVLLFVNVDPSSLGSPELDPQRLAAEFGTPERVVIEITERGGASVDRVVQGADALRAAGFTIAIDDAGAGHTGLELLRRLAPEFIKVDRSVIAAARDDRGARSVLWAILVFAAGTGAFVVAEGIEDEDTLAFLRTASGPSGADVRVHGGQGYHLGMPIVDTTRSGAVA